MTLTKLIKVSTMGEVMLMGLSMLSQPAEAIDWKFSYTASNVGGAGVAGTVDALLITDGMGYDTITTYNVTGISGTANGSPIVGLWTKALPAYPSSKADNQFRWNGTTSILLTIDGIAFYNVASQLNNPFSSSGNPNFANYFDSTSRGSSSIALASSSSLTPTAVPWETDALPVIGSTILFVGGLWAKRKFAKPLQK